MTTDFQNKVYNQAKLIPIGKVTTYKSIALTLQSSPRAVANALSCNTFRAVPCHRVVGVNRKLKGYYKKTDNNALNAKKKILIEEGVLFEGELVSKSCFV
eukprot:NODE_220_length_13988_cov_0.426885.p7 type:complete len:100 gc:universal NODE_220_length_13988_cov_0.426885:7781-7482(-)